MFGVILFCKMPENPEISTPEPKQRLPLRKRVRVWAVLGGLYAVILAMGVFGVKLLVSGLGHHVSADEWLMRFAGAAALLLMPCAVAWYFLKMRWKTGRWLGTKEARQQQRTQCAVRQGRRPNGGIQSPPWSWVLLAAYWGSYNAMDTAAPVGRRMAGWSALAGFAALLLAFAGFGVIFLGAGLTTIATGGGVMIFFAALMFVIPVVAVWRCVQRKRTTGRWHVSQDELEDLNGGRRAWREREVQKPLRTKIISTLLFIGVIAFLWARAYLPHGQHREGAWLTPAIWTIFALYGIWIQFRTPKNAPSRDIL
jgi:hypothetical protein